MKNILLIMPLSLLILKVQPGFSQQKALNIPVLHQLIEDSKSEHLRQSRARDRQGENTAAEVANKSMLVRLQQSYSTLQSRFFILSSAISAAGIALEASPLVEGIISDQRELFTLLPSRPYLSPLVLSSEVELLGHARDLVYYLIGLSASTGALNSMKAADRKLLFDHVILELKRLKAISSGLLSAANTSGRLSKNPQRSPFTGFANPDIRLASQVIKGAKYLNENR